MDRAVATRLVDAHCGVPWESGPRPTVRCSLCVDTYTAAPGPQEVRDSFETRTRSAPRSGSRFFLEPEGPSLPGILSGGRRRLLPRGVLSCRHLGEAREFPERRPFRGGDRAASFLVLSGGCRRDLSP